MDTSKVRRVRTHRQKIVSPFVDMAGFVEDYRVSSFVFDVMLLSAQSLCTHCTFQKIEMSALANVSQYDHRCDIHSENTPFAGQVI